MGEKYLSELFVRIDEQSRIDRIDGLACLSVFGIPIGIIMVNGSRQGNSGLINICISGLFEWEPKIDTANLLVYLLLYYQFH